MATPPGDDWPKHVRERSIFTIWNPLDNRVYGLAAWRARRQAAINNANNGSGPGGGNNGTGPPGHPRFHGPPDPDYPQRDGSGPNHVRSWNIKRLAINGEISCNPIMIISVITNIQSLNLNFTVFN